MDWIQPTQDTVTRLKHVNKVMTLQVPNKMGYIRTIEQLLAFKNGNTLNWLLFYSLSLAKYCIVNRLHINLFLVQEAEGMWTSRTSRQNEATVCPQ